jgi:TRAP-type C4-dicarboxylate transport system permease small subunit
MGSRAQATLRIVANLFVLAAALAFLWWGIEFTRFALGRISELAELPLWLIHVAWPLAGATWIVFLGEHFYDDLRTVLGRAR